MKQVSLGSKAYLGAIKALRKLINEHYRDGGWLPSGREMAKNLSVSHSTYCKALKFVEKESLVTSYPKKGHYVVPSYLWTRKVGLIITMGEESPFIRQDSGISKAMDYLYSFGFDSHIVQGSTLDQLYENALIHGMEGLIWFDPSKKALAEIKRIRRDGTIPLVVVQLSDLDIDFGTGTVLFDIRKNIAKRADLLIEQGYKKIAYVGNYDDLKKFEILSVLQDAGINITPAYCIFDTLNNPGAVTELILKKDVEALFVDRGAGIRFDFLLKELSQLPDEKQPDVLVSYFPQLEISKKLYPKVKLVFKQQKQTDTLGEAAAKMLVDHIRQDIPLETIKIELV